MSNVRSFFFSPIGLHGFTSLITLLFILPGCASSDVETIAEKEVNPLYGSTIEEAEGIIKTDGDLVNTFSFNNSQYSGYYFHESNTPGDFMLFKDNSLISIQTYNGFQRSWEISPAYLEKQVYRTIILPYENGMHDTLNKLILNDIENKDAYDDNTQDLITNSNPMAEDGLSWSMIVSIGIPSGLITSPDIINAYMKGAHIVRKWVSVPLGVSSSTALLHIGYPSYKVVSSDLDYEIWEYSTVMTTLYIGFRDGRLEWKFNDNEKVHAYFDHIKQVNRPRLRYKPSV